MSDEQTKLMQQDVLESYRQQSEARHREILQMAQMNPDDARELELNASTLYTLTGQISFATAFIYGTVTVQGSYIGGPAMNFHSEMWGVGFGGGVGLIVCTLTVPANELVGRANFQFNTAPGGTQITWWNHKGYLGTGLAPNLSVGGGITGGSGDWTKR